MLTVHDEYGEPQFVVHQKKTRRGTKTWRTPLVYQPFEARGQDWRAWGPLGVQEAARRLRRAAQKEVF